MKNSLRATFLFLFTLFILPHPAQSEMQTAKMAAPQPPEQNPHPPQSAEEIKIVKFAEEAVQILLTQSLPSSLKKTDTGTVESFQNKSLECLKNIDCYTKDLPFVNELIRLQETNGKITEVRHPHLIPWSMKRMNMRSSTSNTKKVSADFAPVPNQLKAPQLKADEFMVHMYVKFDKSERWYHLDAILAQDAQGKIFLRYFYTLPMPSSGGKLPPGAVC